MFKSSKVALRGLRRLRFFGVGILTFSCAQLVTHSILDTDGKWKMLGYGWDASQHTGLFSMERGPKISLVFLNSPSA
jgi:hypothetical protein